MKKLFVINLALGLALLFTVAFNVHAQTIPGNAAQPCSASNVTSDSCYVQYCTGVSSEDSASCNAYASYVVQRDDGGNTSCQSIGASNEKSCCLDANGNLVSPASPMCIAYEDNSSAEIAKDAGAALTSGNGGGTFTPNGTPAAGTPASVGLNIHLNNPLSGVNTIPDAINKLLGIVIRIALPLIVIFFIWSGFTFITARGNPTQIIKARNMFLFTIIGTLLILGAWVITNAIIGTVNAIIS